MRRSRQTKIIATIGPGSSTEEKLSTLYNAGADVFRFNLSHGTYEAHAEQLRRVRQLEEQVGRPIGVFGDLQGPKLRIGRFAESGVVVPVGSRFRLDLSDEPGDGDRIQLPHPEIFEVLRPGALLLLDDGKVQIEVISCGADFADTKVLVGGPLSNHKGVNLPNVLLEVSPLTAKDRRDLEFALDLGIGMIALSFVQRPQDVEDVQQLIAGRARLISKIEKPTAIKHLEEIVELTDSVMVARGDLGVELPPETVPAIQKRIIRCCRQAGKPVIVATQMLDSMVTSPTPTRAEASDVANAVYEGADAVMLSAETAVGRYPVQSVEMMDKIIRQTEIDPSYAALLDAGQAKPKSTTADTITESAKQAATILPAAAIVTFTNLGSTALRAARKRPPVPILAMTTSIQVARSLSLVWGIHAIRVNAMNDYEALEAEAIKTAIETNFARAGDNLVITAGLPLPIPCPTNVMRLVRVKGSDSGIT